MTEKKKSEAKRKFRCACAMGDLSAVQPVMASPKDETTAKPVESRTSKPSTAAARVAVDKQKTKG